MRKQVEEPALNMTPMIDVVFQLIIFFVTTVDLQNKALDVNLRLAMAPHGPPVETKNPREIVIDVLSKGQIMLAHTRMSHEALRSELRRMTGGYDVPVIIRGDGKTNHEDIKKVMDACSAAGLWKVKFAALKEKS